MNTLTDILQKEFTPYWLLADRHLMTIASAFWLRNFSELVASETRWYVDVSQSSKVLVDLNFNAEDGKSKNTNETLVIVVHGLEGSSRSHYVCGVAKKGLDAGLATARMNLRNCGGTSHLTDTLYNAGMSSDVIEVASQAIEKYGFKNVFLVGYSLGGNIVLKAAAELKKTNSNWLKGVCAISPSIDLGLSVDQLELGINRIYEFTFLKSLKAKIREKSRQFPDKFPVEDLKSVKTVRQFDEVYTARDGGYKSANHYYSSASANNLIQDINVPGLIITSKDDPIVPYRTFLKADIENEFISILAPESGGHGAFLGSLKGVNGGKPLDRFWAEDRAIEFCLSNG